MPLLFVAAFFLFEHFQDEAVVLDQAYADCVQESENRSETGSCLQGLAVKATRAFSTPQIEGVISSLPDVEQKLWCHEFMHYVGWEATKRRGGIFEAFDEASGICDSGMYHGIVEEYMLEQEQEGDLDRFTKEVIPHACVKGAQSRHIPDAVISNCHHGLGHAFMFITNNDLPKALEYCDLVGVKFAGSCYTGALMENIGSKEVGRFGVHPNKEYAFQEDRPDYPCNILDPQYRTLCYEFKGASGTNNGQYEQAFRECLRVDPSYQLTCFHGVGINIPGPHMTPHQASETCKFALAIDPKGYEPCIDGAMSFLVQLNLGEGKPAREFCDNVTPEYQHACYLSAGRMLGYWSLSSEELTKKCEAFLPAQGREECLSGRKF